MMHNDDFAPPPPKIKITEFEGSLLLITAHEVLRDVPSEFSKSGDGKSDVTVADIVVIAPDGTGAEFEGIWIFQGGLQGQLRPRVGNGKRTLARLARGPSPKGEFQWIFADPSDADSDAARRYLLGRVTTSPPAATQQSPAGRQAPAGGPPF